MATIMEFAQVLWWLPASEEGSRVRYLSTSAFDPRVTNARTDEDLMQCWQSGDPTAFGILYSRFADRLFRFVLRNTSSQAEAEEICQEAWLAVVNGRARYRPSARFVTYLFSIAQRRSIDRRRRDGRHREVGSELFDVLSTPDEETLQPEKIAHNAQNAGALLAAITELPVLQREAFLMQAEGDMSLEEIAVATGSAREAVKSRLRYALRRLRAALADHR